MSIMADRDQDRHAHSDDANRDAPRGKVDADPLAELARLIGQTDPFANFGRANPSHPTRRTQPVEPPPQAYAERQARETAADAPATPASGPTWMKHRPLQNRPPVPTPSPVETPAVDQDTDINATPHPLHRYAAQQARAEPETQHLPDHASPSFATGADPYANEVPHDAYAQQPEHHDDRYDDALYGAVQPTPEELYAQQHGHSAGYVDDGYGDPENGYDDADERKPRRKGLMTVAAVMALAIVGTGGAYAYRNYVASPRSGEPPVIKADTNPIKVVPPTNAGDASGKLIQDRLAAGNGAEKLVSREETPVDPRDPSKAGPRVVFPPLNANGNPPSTSSVSPAGKSMANAPQAAPGDEPRKIKTFAVKGDQTDTAGVPVAKPAPRAPAAKQPAANSNASANAPMSLSPQSAATADPRSRVATTTPTQAAPASSGNYVVQVASQRSESDAQASYKALQSKYPSVLGSRSAQIKKADLGDKGTYYRAVVGPFNSSEDASTVCNNLKVAGGQCVVQRN